MESNSAAFNSMLKDREDGYLIALVKRVIPLLEKAEEDAKETRLPPPYSSYALKKYLGEVSHSRDDLLSLVKFVYADSYFNLLQAQDVLAKHTDGLPPIASPPIASPPIASPLIPSPVISPVPSPVDSDLPLTGIFKGFVKKNSRHKGGKKRNTLRRRRKASKVVTVA